MNELDPSKIPTQPKRSFNLLLILVLVGLAGIALYLFLERHYAQQNASGSGDPELAQFELDAQIKSLQPVLDALESYYVQNQSWPNRLDQLELEPQMRDSFPGLNLLENGQLRFQGSESLGDYQQGTVQLTPEGTPGNEQFTWRCRAEAIPDEYLPTYCRVSQ